MKLPELSWQVFAAFLIAIAILHLVAAIMLVFPVLSGAKSFGGVAIGMIFLLGLSEASVKNIGVSGTPQQESHPDFPNREQGRLGSQYILGVVLISIVYLVTVYSSRA